MSSFYFVGTFAFKPMIRRYGRLALTIFVSVLEAVLIACFGLAGLVPNNELFFVLSLATRILIGFCSLTSVMTIMLMITTDFNRSRTRMSIFFLGIQLAEVFLSLDWSPLQLLRLRGLLSHVEALSSDGWSAALLFQASRVKPSLYGNKD